MKSQKTKAIIFSAFQTSASEERNWDNHQFTIFKLQRHGIPYKVLSGVYKGASEPSFVVSAEHRDMVLHLCKMFRQESYLEQHGDGTCTLEFLSGGFQPLAELRQVSRAEALTFESYSYDPVTKRYWVAA